MILMCKSRRAQRLKGLAHSSLIAFHRSVLISQTLMQPEMIDTALGLGIPEHGPGTHPTGQAYRAQDTVFGECLLCAMHCIR